MIVEGEKIDAMQYSVQYELLRSQISGALCSATQGNTPGRTRGIGLALLLSEGMPGWLKTVESVLRASLAPRTANAPDASPPETVPRYSATPSWLPTLHRDEIATLLASLCRLTRPPGNRRKESIFHANERRSSSEDHDRASVAPGIPVRAPVNVASGL